MNSKTIEVIVTCQQANYGAKRPRITNTGNHTKSARHFKFNISDLGLIDPSSENSEAGVEEKQQAHQPATTWTYRYEGEVTESNVKAITRFLDRFDANSKTPDYVRKATAYNEQKALVLREIDPKSLDGAGKLDYYNKLSRFCFKYYTVKVVVKIWDNDADKVIRSTFSKTHYRLTKLSEREMDNQIELCGFDWEDQNSDEETSSSGDEN